MEKVIIIHIEADALRRLGKFTEAIIWYNKSILVEPKYKESSWGKGI